MGISQGSTDSNLKDPRVRLLDIGPIVAGIADYLGCSREHLNDEVLGLAPSLEQKDAYVRILGQARGEHTSCALPSPMTI